MFISIRYFEEECINRFEKLDPAGEKQAWELGKYVESISHSMPLQNKKIACFNLHIGGVKRTRKTWERGLFLLTIKKTGLAWSTQKRYTKSTSHCLILCQNIVGELYTIISECNLRNHFRAIDLTREKFCTTMRKTKQQGSLYLQAERK